ncbi:hypothetical protein EPUS_08620 [Endocarpon pusillum Z07020]|uniref:Heterokaryon incompatibility domain-containing protein n=1 Tax=Endocarpon pusillum (strain Z07020 / HMAS-L-300199) TaxID=1263415 RepID=U1GUG7_ENDPU|nr:uncharacterized protein EPUS_08620 [Endocarpon pusillum Z07020]ERF75666.1 hypothetical protein EPUS_08620 [Endocarpon pusillum Z07020]
MVVPCLSSVAYDQLDFNTYPRRRGWDCALLAAGDFSQKDARATEAFIQDWLYFGVLWETLGEAAVKSVYVEPHPTSAYGRITTTLLRGQLLHRLAYLGQLCRDDAERAWSLIRKADNCLERLSAFCCLADCEGGEDHARVVWPLSPEVDFSLRALGQSLSSAFAACLFLAVRKYEAVVFRNLRFPGACWVVARMASNNWCSSDISRVVEQYSPSSLYYISLMRRAGTTRDHSSCTKQKCLAFQVDPSRYRTKHLDEHCACSFLGPQIAEVVRIIMSGKIPLLSIIVDERADAVVVSVEPYKAGVEYIAISHVWADGLGNTDRNTLPRCQLLRMRQLLDELRDQASLNVSMRFWLDTLCVPVRQHHANARDRAICQMKDVYMNAYQVLVLDTELQSVDPLDISEAFMRISLSGWMRRLWTLHEGVLGNRLHIKFRNATLNLEKGYKELGFKFQPELAREFENVFGTPMADARQTFWRMRSMRDEIFVGPERKMVGISTKTTVYKDAYQQLVKGRCVRIMLAFDACRYRTPSRTEDLYICLANLLGWDTSDLWSEPVNRRMRLLLEQQEVLPQGVLFVPGPRMHERGWGWAVTEFANEAQSRMRAPITDSSPARRDASGLTVRYPGLILPGAIVPDGPRDIVISSSTGHNSECLTWWRITLLDHQNRIGSTDVDVPSIDSAETPPPDTPKDSMCVVFFQPQMHEIRVIVMPAALLALENFDRHKIIKTEDRIHCKFLDLATIQMISTDDALSALLRRRDLQLLHVKEQARYVSCAWTVQ